MLECTYHNFLHCMLDQFLFLEHHMSLLQWNSVKWNWRDWTRREVEGLKNNDNRVADIYRGTAATRESPLFLCWNKSWPTFWCCYLLPEQHCAAPKLNSERQMSFLSRLVWLTLQMAKTQENAICFLNTWIIILLQERKRNNCFKDFPLGRLVYSLCVPRKESWNEELVSLNGP